MSLVATTCEVCRKYRVEDREHSYSHFIRQAWTCRWCDVRNGCTKKFVDETNYETTSCCDDCDNQRDCRRKDVNYTIYMCPECYKNFTS